MQCKGAIFDFDGTLVDSMSIWQEVGAIYLKDMGYTPPPQLCQILSPMSLEQSAHYLKENYALPQSISQIIQGVLKKVEEFYRYQVQPKPNVLPFLEKLQAKGVKMCIASSTDQALIQAVLERYKMESFFEQIFTCSAVGYGKDNPFIFEQALAFLRTPKQQTLVFEDAYYAVKTAKSANFCVVAIYDQYESHPKEVKSLADVYLSQYPQADSFLQQIQTL